MAAQKLLDKAEGGEDEIMKRLDLAANRAFATRCEKVLVTTFSSSMSLQEAHSSAQRAIKELRAAKLKERDWLHPTLLKRSAKALVMRQ